MASPFNPDEVIKDEYFINDSERNVADPSQDEGKLPQLENTGRLSKQFIPLTMEVVTNSQVSIDQNSTTDVTYNHNLGKVPTRISADNSHIGPSIGSWVNGNQSCIAADSQDNIWRRQSRIFDAWGGATSSGACNGRTGWVGGEIIDVDEDTFTVRYETRCSSETVPSGAVRFVIEA